MPIANQGIVWLVLDDDRVQDGGSATARRLRRAARRLHPSLVVCDARALRRSDLAVVDVVCRLKLEAGRCGARLILSGASPALRRVLALTGLAGVIPCRALSGYALRRGPLSVEVVGQAEEREEPGGVQEEGDAADPVP